MCTQVEVPLWGKMEEKTILYYCFLSFQMLNNITNDLDLLLAEFCDLPYPDQGEPPPTKNKPIRAQR